MSRTTIKTTILFDYISLFFLSAALLNYAFTPERSDIYLSAITHILFILSIAAQLLSYIFNGRSEFKFQFSLIDALPLIVLVSYVYNAFMANVKFVPFNLLPFHLDILLCYFIGRVLIHRRIIEFSSIILAILLSIILYYTLSKTTKLPDVKSFLFILYSIPAFIILITVQSIKEFSRKYIRLFEILLVSIILLSTAVITYTFVHKDAFWNWNIETIPGFFKNLDPVAFFLGYGEGNFNSIANMLRLDSEIYTNGLLHYFISNSINLGIIGFALNIIILVLLFSYIIQKVNSLKGEKSRVIVLCFFLIIINSIVAKLFYASKFEYSNSFFIWLLIGASISSVNYVSLPEPVHSPEVVRRYRRNRKLLPITMVSLFTLFLITIQCIPLLSNTFIKGKIEGNKYTLNKLKLATNIFPYNPSSYILLAHYYKEQIDKIGNSTELFANLSNMYFCALRLNPFDEQITYEFAEMYVKNKNFPEAIEVAKKGLIFLPDSSKLRYLLIKLYEQEKDYKSILKYLMELEDLFPKDYFINIRKYELYKKMGDNKDALKELYTALQKNPADPKIYKLIDKLGTQK